MPLSWERRHLPDNLWFFKRAPGGGGGGRQIFDCFLLESDIGLFTEDLLLESSEGCLLLESAPSPPSFILLQSDPGSHDQFVLLQSGGADALMRQNSG